MELHDFGYRPQENGRRGMGSYYAGAPDAFTCWVGAYRRARVIASNRGADFYGDSLPSSLGGCVFGVEAWEAVLRR
jgi:hypothetical protein